MEYYFSNMGKEQKTEKAEKYEVILEYKIGKDEKKEYITIYPNAIIYLLML